MEPTIFVDVDGFLARFTCGACAVHNRPNETPIWTTWNHWVTWGIPEPDLYAPLGRDFWSALLRWEDGFALLTRVEELVGRDRIAFLTAPVQTPGCEDGKREWFREHLPQFSPWADLFIGGAKHKAAGPLKILLDDSDSNCDKFIACGGSAVLVPRPWNHRRSECRSDGSFDPDAIFTEVELAVRTAILRTHPRAAG